MLSTSSAHLAKHNDTICPRTHDISQFTPPSEHRKIQRKATGLKVRDEIQGQNKSRVSHSEQLLAAFSREKPVTPPIYATKQSGFLYHRISTSQHTVGNARRVSRMVTTTLPPDATEIVLKSPRRDTTRYSEHSQAILIITKSPEC